MRQAIARDRYLSDAEVKSLLAASRIPWRTRLRDHAFLALLVNTGIRPGEAVALTAGDLKLTDRGGTMRVRRLKKRRDHGVIDDLPLTRDLVRILRAHVFRFVKNPPATRPVFDFTVRTGENIFRRAANRAGLDRAFTLYCLRHTFGTRARRRLKDLRLVQSLMGHASIESTQIYAHVSEEERRQAAETLGTEV